MPITVPAVRRGTVVVPQSVPPNYVAVRASLETYTFDTTEDFFSADIAPNLGTNIFSGSLQVHPKFAGMHYHRSVPTVRHSIARNLDCVGCSWSDVARARGTYDWAALDAFVATAAAASRDIVYCFASTPTWASARPNEAGHYVRGGLAEPARTEDIADFAAAVCERYKNLGTPITAFEIWNEPKFERGGGVAQGNYFTGTAAALAAMARVLYRRIKAIDASALVLSPAPTGLEFNWNRGDASGTDHLNSFLGASDGAGSMGGTGGTGRDWVDAIAFHAYSHNGYNNLYAIPMMLANVRQCMANHALDGRPIWITEVSAITPVLASFSVARQQTYIARTLLLALGAGAERVIWYAWDDKLGFDKQPAVAAEWDRLVAALAGARLSLVNSLRNKQVAAVVDGVRWLV